MQTLSPCQSPVAALRDDASLNVIIPMGGSNESFADAGFNMPKPLIKVAGKTIIFHIIDRLKVRVGDVIWLLMPTKQYTKCEVEIAQIRQHFKHLDLRIVTFNMETRGALETIFIGLQHISPTQLSRKTICLDSNNVYFSNVLGDFRNLRKGKGACFYFNEVESSSYFSYIQMDPQSKRVLDISEKLGISNQANVGAYGFASGKVLYQYTRQVLDDDSNEPMKYHVSKLIGKMIRDNYEFVGLLADNVANCGTPTRLEAFIADVSTGKVLHETKRRFCFGLDDVLLTRPRYLATTRPAK